MRPRSPPASTCVVTASSYTVDEDFTGAALVVLQPGGDAGRARPRCWPTRTASHPDPVVDLDDTRRP